MEGDRPVRSSIRRMVKCFQDNDDAGVEATIRELGQSRRLLAPLTFTVGAVMMLLQGVRLLFVNWRLSLVQVLPAMWIWAAMLNLKLHVIKGRGFNHWNWPVALLLVALATVVTIASYHLNAVFAFAIARPGAPDIRSAFHRAAEQKRTTVVVGGVIGLALGVSSVIVPRWGSFWFALSLGAVVAVMMLTYVLVPSRMVGMAPKVSRRDALAAGVVGGVVGAIVCTPAYVLGRVGIVLLGSGRLFVLGIILVCIGGTLQAGATGAVKAVKMSAKLMTGRPAGPDPEPEPATGHPVDEVVEPAGADSTTTAIEAEPLGTTVTDPFHGLEKETRPR